MIAPDGGKAPPSGADSPPEARAARPKGGKPRSELRESPPEGRALASQGRTAPTSGQNAPGPKRAVAGSGRTIRPFLGIVQQEGSLVHVRIAVSHFELQTTYTLD